MQQNLCFAQFTSRNRAPGEIIESAPSLKLIKCLFINKFVYQHHQSIIFMIFEQSAATRFNFQTCLNSDQSQKDLMPKMIKFRPRLDVGGFWGLVCVCVCVSGSGKGGLNAQKLEL
jgi:hypothetical protein